MTDYQSVAAACVVVERVTEFVKNAWDAGKYMNEWQYKMYVHAVALLVSIPVAYIAAETGATKTFPSILQGGYGTLLLGILISSGSSVWNTAVDALNKLEAKVTVPTTAKPPEK